MSKVRVLISDPMSSQAVEVFEQRGIDVVQTGKMTEGELPVSYTHLTLPTIYSV